MPAAIDPAAKRVTLINVFTVNPGMQDFLADLLAQATEEVMRHQPGFISASIHKSLDGAKVINVAQWRSKADFEAMQKNPRAQKHMRSAANLARFDPIVCEVASSHSA